jgi:four helix bundle protein
MESTDIADRAFRFSCRIVDLYGRLVTKGGAAREIAGQLLDCGTSIGASLDGAPADRGTPDAAARMGLARKGARETVYWLRLLVVSESVRGEEVAWELHEAEQFLDLLGSPGAACAATP